MYALILPAIAFLLAALASLPVLPHGVHGQVGALSAAVAFLSIGQIVLVIRRR